jgi:hypothetical protein
MIHLPCLKKWTPKPVTKRGTLVDGKPTRASGKDFHEKQGRVFILSRTQRTIIQ